MRKESFTSWSCFNMTFLFQFHNDKNASNIKRKNGVRNSKIEASKTSSLFQYGMVWLWREVPKCIWYIHSLSWQTYRKWKRFWKKRDLLTNGKKRLGPYHTGTHCPPSWHTQKLASSCGLTNQLSTTVPTTKSLLCMTGLVCRTTNSPPIPLTEMELPLNRKWSNTSGQLAGTVRWVSSGRLATCSYWIITVFNTENWASMERGKYWLIWRRIRTMYKIKYCLTAWWTQLSYV